MSWIEVTVQGGSTLVGVEVIVGVLVGVDVWVGMYGSALDLGRPGCRGRINGQRVTPGRYQLPVVRQSVRPTIDRLGRFLAVANGWRGGRTGVDATLVLDEYRRIIPDGGFCNRPHRLARPCRRLVVWGSHSRCLDPLATIDCLGRLHRLSRPRDR